MTGYSLTLRDVLGGLAFAVPLAFLAWQAGAWLWRLTGRLVPPAGATNDNHTHKKD